MGLFLAGALLAGLPAPHGRLAAYDKKVRVAADYAHVYLQPDEGSPVVDTVERGSVLSLLYGGKMKRAWYYVCFKSEKTGNTKSGYVLDSEVELLFEPLQSILIQEDRESLRIEYPPRNFDEMPWGVTRKQVVESEGKPSSQTKAKGRDVLLYKQRVINLDCDVEFWFEANRLRQTRFLFAQGSPDKNDCLNNYRKVKDALIRRFGKPLEENMDWHDASCKDDFSAWGTAVARGDLELRSRWLTPKTEILATLAGENEEISLSVTYKALRLGEVAKFSQEDD